MNSYPGLGLFNSEESLDSIGYNEIRKCRSERNKTYKFPASLACRQVKYVGECCLCRRQDQAAEGSMPKSERQKEGWIKKKQAVRD